MNLFPGGFQPAYAGDAVFARQLDSLGCSTPLHQIKTLCLGAIAATNVARLSRLMGAVWGGKEPVFESEAEAQQFLSNLMGLYNRMAAHQDGAPYRLTAVEPQETVEDIARYAQVRQEEITGFCRGLDLGDTRPEAMTERARKALQTLAEGAAFYDKYEELAKAGREADPHNRPDAFAALRQLDAIIEDCMAIIQMEQKQARAQRMRSQTGIDQTFRAVPGARGKTGRNDPCPCGSGRKYKHCCGRH